MSEFTLFKVPLKPNTSPPSLVQEEPISTPKYSHSPTALLADYKLPPESLSLFSSLPLELRQEIWFWTFEPRIVTIYIHLDMTAQGGYNNVLSSRVLDETCWSCRCARSVGQFPSNTSVTFSGTVGVRPGAGLGRTLPPVPVALHVCRDSRAFALKHYQPCFSGTRYVYDFRSKREFGKREFGEKKIWIAPKWDTIFLDEAAKDLQYQRLSENQEEHRFRGLDFLVNFAEQDARKIRKLAVSATLVENARAHRQQSRRWRPWPPYGNTPEFCLATALHKSLKGFPNLEQLLVYRFEKTLEADGDHFYTWIDPEAARENIERICLEAEGHEDGSASVKLPAITVQSVIPETWPLTKDLICIHRRYV